MAAEPVAILERTQQQQQQQQTTTPFVSSPSSLSLAGFFPSAQEREERLRAFDAQFEQDYADRNQYYADKLAKKKVADQQELQADQDFVNRGVMDQYVYQGRVQTDRGDSLLPQGRLAKGLFPDPFPESKE